MKKCGWAFNAVLADLPFSAADCWALGRNCRTPAAVSGSAGWTQPPGASAKSSQSFLTNTDFWRRTFSFLNEIEGGWDFTKSLWISFCRADLKIKMKRCLPINKLHPGPKICSCERTGEAWAVSNVPTAYDTVTNTLLPQRNQEGRRNQNPNNLIYSRPVLSI